MDIFIGIDGGGTKTEAAAIDRSGRVLSRYTGSSTNPYVVGFEHAMAELARVLDSLLAQLPDKESAFCGACLGLAGISSEQEIHKVVSFLQTYQNERGNLFPVSIITEAELALMAALGREYGVLIISGTGSNTYGISRNGERYRAGGWGHLLGDEGSGYMIGLLTLKSVIKSHEGILPATAMTGRIVEHMGFRDITELKAHIYQPSIGKTEIAGFARICIEAAAAGDAAAAAILESQAQELAETASALIKRNPELEQTDVVCTGSIFKYSALFYNTFCRVLSARYPLLTFSDSRASLTPAHGAALSALKRFPSA